MWQTQQQGLSLQQSSSVSAENVNSKLEHSKVQQSHVKCQVNHEPQIAEVTPNSFVDLTEEQIMCHICFKYALNGQYCLTEKCNQLFCESCIVSFRKKGESKCPFCRTSPFNTKPSCYQELINKMELVCKLCKQRYELIQEEKHYKTRCSYFHKIECRFCLKMFEKNEIIGHTKDAHVDRFEDIVDLLFENPRPMVNPSTVIKERKAYLEKIGRSPQIGNSGKFYCGGRLQTKCTCCNGYCGPTNGQNCNQCMRLDLLRFGLPKGYLVNSAGHICYKKGEDFICGVRMLYSGTTCHEGNACSACINMKKNIKRYIDLL